MLETQKTIIFIEVPNELIRYVKNIWWSTCCTFKRLSELSAPIDVLIASDQVQVINFDSSAKVNCEINK